MSKRYLLVIVISFVFLLPFSAECGNVFAPPMPARIGGSVTVDGTPLTQATDDGYTFTVTKQDGTAYVDLNGVPAQDLDGLNANDWYLIDIPIYDAADQTGGANPGDTAVIHIFKDGSELTVTSPSNGEFAVSDSGTITQIDLVANTDTNLKPVANAGPDDTVNESAFVTLDGSGSNDPDGTVDIYSWSQTSGTQVVLSNTAAQKPTFTAPDVDQNGETLTFELTVTDNEGLSSAPDTVDIAVEWVKSTYNATGDWTVSTSNSWAAGGCSPMDEDTSTATVTQTGDNITIVDNEGETYTGKVAGETYTFSGTFVTDDGFTVIMNGTFTLASETSGAGTVVWSANDGEDFCNGGFDLDLAKESQGGGGSSGGGGGGGGCFIATGINGSCMAN